MAPKEPRRQALFLAVVIVAAGAGSMAGAIAGLLAGLGVGRAIGLPSYEFMNDPPGFDDLDSAMIGLVVGWLAGTIAVSYLVVRRRARPSRGSVLVAAGVLGALGFGARFVGSAAADWYFPMVFFVAPPFVMTVVAQRALEDASDGPTTDIVSA